MIRHCQKLSLGLFIYFKNALNFIYVYLLLISFADRSEDSLVFGTTCGGSETYYQESGIKQPGLPTSADLMGTAPLKSKRRLQRDHSITIF